MLPVVLCALGPIDEFSEKLRKEQKESEEYNEYLASEKYLEENINNLKTEQRELEVIVPSETTELLLTPESHPESEESAES